MSGDAGGRAPTLAPLQAIREFLRLESASGILLLGATCLAIAMSNSPLAHLYDVILHTRAGVRIGALAIDKPLLLWINDGLMAIFFLLVGLEIKREILDGELSRPDQVALPAIAALGGMAVPAAIYAALNWSDPAALRGWAIPAATDIAFALGILALAGKAVPLSLKVFLTALAIIDDLGAIVIIALFYTDDLSLEAVAVAVGAAIALAGLNYYGVPRLAPYVLVGAVLWAAVLKSGVHATLAGVVVAMAIPLRAEDDHGHSPARRLEHDLHPSVAYIILPVFAFANSGLSLTELAPGRLVEPVPLGIACGLFLGKQIGVFAFSWATIRLGLGRLPAGASWLQLYGVSVLAGIGFTMSLFIGTLAFHDPALAAGLRAGVIAGSVVSAVVGLGLLRLAGRGRAEAS